MYDSESLRDSRINQPSCNVLKRAYKKRSHCIMRASYKINENVVNILPAYISSSGVDMGEGWISTHTSLKDTFFAKLFRYIIYMMS